jgi:hypothetical protein
MFSIYAHLGQFSYRIGPALAPPRPAEYLVRAYTYVLIVPSIFSGDIFQRPRFEWIQMHQYDRSYPDSNYVGAYMDELCAKGRAIGPLVKGGNTVRNSPVIVRLFRNDEGVWVMERECRS